MYIIDQDKQIALAKEMKQLRRDTENYEAFYHHPYTNQMWKSFFPKVSGDDLGPKLMRHEPLPTSVKAILDICLAENAPENAIGLGIEWSEKAEIWPEIIKILEDNYSDYERGQLKLFLKHLDMQEVELEGAPKTVAKASPATAEMSQEQVDNLIWRSRKIRMKRFFVLG
jgi:hypothetical protein